MTQPHTSPPDRNYADIAGRVRRAYAAYRRACRDDEFNRQSLVCTFTADWLRENSFPEGRRVGYFHEDNPGAKVGEVEGGHDFLLVDERYVLDFWYRTTWCPHAPVLLDLHNPVHQPELRQLYGDPTSWLPGRTAECEAAC